MMAHAETNLRPLLRLGSSVLTEQQLDARLRELAILRVAKLSNAPYEWVQHVDIGKAVGVTDAQITAIEAADAAASCFDAREQLVLRTTDELVRQVRVSDATFAALTREFSPRQIVELIIAIGYYMLVARLLESTGVDIEEPGGGRLFATLRR